MTSTLMIDEALGGTFVTALLLTGSAEGAEAAVLEGIRVMEHGGDSGESLLHGTIAASIATTTPGREATAAPMLPPELRRVLRLPWEFRQCYVLRVLVGLSREVCAQILQTELHRIDELVGTAARALAIRECAAMSGVN